jgi:hypothetical protein
MSRRVLVLVVLIVTGISASNCLPEPEQSPLIIERGSFEGSSFITELPISNCQSAEALQIDQRIDQKFAHDVEILRTPDSKISPTELAKAVREHYQVESLVEVASLTVNANVPAGSVFVYLLEWTELWREGEIEIGEIDDNPEATYQFLQSLAGGVVDIRTRSCASEVTESPTPDRTTTPSATTVSPVPEVGRLEITHPSEMVAGEADVVTVEIIADPRFSGTGVHPEHVTGTIVVEVRSNGEVRERIESEIRLYPFMSVELTAVNFEIDGNSSIRRAITPIQPAVWTWNITAESPGTQRITISVFGEATINGEEVIVLEESVSRNIKVLERPLSERIGDGLVDNLVPIIGTGGPLGVIILYLTYRRDQETKRLEEKIESLEKRLKEQEHGRNAGRDSSDEAGRSTTVDAETDTVSME